MYTAEAKATIAMMATTAMMVLEAARLFGTKTLTCKIKGNKSLKHLSECRRAYFTEWSLGCSLR